MFSVKNYIRSVYWIVQQLAVSKYREKNLWYFLTFSDGKLSYNQIGTSDVVFHAEHARTIHFYRKLIV